MNFFTFVVEAFLAKKVNLVKGLAKSLNLQKQLTTFGKQLQGSAVAFLEQPQQIANFLKTILNRPQNFMNALKRLPDKELQKLNNLIKTEMTQRNLQEGIDFQLLSSSWIASGSYKPANKTMGNITITTIKGGRSYDFTATGAIKFSTWEHMKQAQGRNGSGAGSVFWREYWFKHGGIGGFRISKSKYWH